MTYIHLACARISEHIARSVGNFFRQIVRPFITELRNSRRNVTINTVRENNWIQSNWVGDLFMNQYKSIQNFPKCMIIFLHIHMTDIHGGRKCIIVTYFINHKAFHEKIFKYTVNFIAKNPPNIDTSRSIDLDSWDFSKILSLGSINTFNKSLNVIIECAHKFPALWVPSNTCTSQSLFI